MTDTVEARLCLPPRPLRNGPGLRLPEGSCDSHFHVFAANAPLTSPRSYTPQIETIDGWLKLADSFGIARGVLVQPSVYGTDNQVLLAALAHHAERLRGVVVIGADTPASHISRLDTLGVRGVRINLRNKGGVGLDTLAELAPRIREYGWHVQFQVGPEAIEIVASLAEEHGVTGVIDHLAFMPLDAPAPALAALQRALDTGRVLTKISAPYRLRDSKNHDGYRQVVQALAANHADKLLWGSDWPHTELFDTVPEEDDVVALSLEALPTAAHRLVFVDTPNALYWSH